MAYRLLARVAVARGRWSAARAQLDSAATFDPTSALELRSLLAILPFLQLPRAELHAVGGVQEWPAGVERLAKSSHSAAHTGLHPYVRLYRLGLLDTRLGDMTAALQRPSVSSGARLVEGTRRRMRSARSLGAFGPTSPEKGPAGRRA